MPLPHTRYPLKRPISSARRALRLSWNGVIACSAAALLLAASARAAALDNQRPNIILVICDDLNDAVGGMGRVPSATTPHLDSLRASGVAFLNASANAPVCVPSRNSLLSGRHPHTLRHYGLADAVDSLPALRGAAWLPAVLRKAGYTTLGCGKVFHGGASPSRSTPAETLWDEFRGGVDCGPFAFDPSAPSPLERLRIHPRQQALLENPAAPDLCSQFHDPHWMRDRQRMKFEFENGFAPLEDVPPGGWHRGDGTPFRFVSDSDRDLMEDEKSAAYAADVLGRRHGRPFFLAVGLLRPHTPLHVPRKYFDRFPLDSISLPDLRSDELAGTSAAMQGHRPYGRLRREFLKAGGDDTLRQWLQAYLGSIAFVDDQLGVILHALAKGPNADNTVVVLTSDNGYHMGDKGSLFKDTLWEGSTRVPLVAAGPGIARGECGLPVSLVDLYPTILDLAGVQAIESDGFALTPLLRDPDDGRWGGPSVAVSAVRGLTGVHFAARSTTHRYILCENGDEELYNHTTDPLEHHNLAETDSAAPVKSELRRKLENYLEICDAHGRALTSISNPKSNP